MKLIYSDDLVTEAASPSREQIDAAMALIEKICGPARINCLRHGDGCEMRRPNCIIHSVREMPTEN